MCVQVQLPSPEAKAEWDYFGSEEEESDMDEEDGESDDEGLDDSCCMESSKRGSVLVDEHITGPPPHSERAPLTISLGLQCARKQVMKNPLAEKTDVMVATCLQYLYYVCHESSPGIHHPVGMQQCWKNLLNYKASPTKKGEVLFSKDFSM